MLHRRDGDVDARCARCVTSGLTGPPWSSATTRPDGQCIRGRTRRCAAGPRMRRCRSEFAARGRAPAGLCLVEAAMSCLLTRFSRSRTSRGRTHCSMSSPGTTICSTAGVAITAIRGHGWICSVLSSTGRILVLLQVGGRAGAELRRGAGEARREGGALREKEGKPRESRRNCARSAGAVRLARPDGRG